MPEGYKQLHSGSTKYEERRSKIKQMERDDPSEGARSNCTSLPEELQHVALLPLCATIQNRCITTL